MVATKQGLRSDAHIFSLKEAVPISTTMTVEEAQAHLAELIAQLTPGQEIIITDNNQPVAILTGQGMRAHQPRQPGSAKGKVIIPVEDKEHLEDFKNYMP